MDPKVFPKAPLAPIYTNFEGGAHAKKTRFFNQIFQKSVLKRFLAYFFKILPAAQKIWPKPGLFSAWGELGKSI